MIQSAEYAGPGRHYVHMDTSYAPPDRRTCEYEMKTTTGYLASQQEEERNQLLMIAARWEAICDILAGVEPSEFLLSFGEVRQVFDLWQNANAGER